MKDDDEIIESDIIDDIEQDEGLSALENFNALKSVDSNEVINALQNKKILETVKNDKDVDKQLTDNAKSVINTHINTIKKNAEKTNQHANFSVNEMACDLYGVNQDCPKWQQKLMVIGNSVWFVIYWVIASVSIVPLNFFIKMIGGIIKKNWVVCLIAVLFYVIILLLIVGTPILLSQL